MQDYSEMAKAYRPSHADATYDFKYGVRAVQVSFVVYIYIYELSYCTTSCCTFSGIS